MSCNTSGAGMKFLGIKLCMVVIRIVELVYKTCDSNSGKPILVMFRNPRDF